MAIFSYYLNAPKIAKIAHIATDYNVVKCDFFRGIFVHCEIKSALAHHDENRRNLTLDPTIQLC